MSMGSAPQSPIRESRRSHGQGLIYQRHALDARTWDENKCRKFQFHESFLTRLMGRIGASLRDLIAKPLRASLEALVESSQ